MTDLERYIKSIWNISVLPHKETNALIKKAQKGNIKARNKVITHNLRLVMNVVKKYNRHHKDKLDLVSAGNFGLFRAIEKFDPKKGYKFSTYAYIWIRQTVQRHILEKCYTVRTPVYRWGEISQIRKKVDVGESLTPKEKRILAKWDVSICSLDKETIEEHNLYSLLTSDHTEELNRSEVADMKRAAQKVMKPFTDREKAIFEYRCQGKTLREIGYFYGISHERVRQIMESITKRLVEKLKKG